MDGWCHVQLKGCQGVNWIRRENDPMYVLIELIQLTWFMAPLHEILPVHGLSLCYIYVPGISADVTFSASTPFLRQEIDHLFISYPMKDPAQAQEFLCWSPFWTQFDSPFPTWSELQLPTWFDLVFLIQLDSRYTNLFLNRVTQFKSHFSQTSGSPT